MADGDPFATRRDLATDLAAELSAVGLDDAREIGRGGFAVVFRCVQTALDRTVAVKVLTRDLDEKNRARFLREQRAMGRLTGHPNIVNVLHVGATESGYPYLVMQYHVQDSLAARIRTDGPLTVAEVLRLGVKICGALETAHRIGILHRDVKPGNILVTAYGEPALTDFGIAHFAGGFETASGVVTGSPAFTAPEILRGESPSPASDVYSLGATLFCALTGHAAFERRTGEQVVSQFVRITTQPIPDLRTHGIPDELAGVIERAMAGNPRERPAPAADLGDELREIQLRNDLPVDGMSLLPKLGGVSNGNAVERMSVLPGTRLSKSVARSATGNLPFELTSFVGRRRELLAAQQKLSASRLVTLTGIGGVGKTRLALRSAADVRSNYRDGVWLVELGELIDASLLVDVVAAALGRRNQSARPMEDVLIESLVPRDMLLVLDNCEQIVDAVARLAETLLRSCPDLRILATSREPLGIDGESVLRVPPLTVPDPDHEPALMGLPRFDALLLFEERAAAAVPGFELTDGNVGAAAQICRDVDGLPLAIELAAARLRAMSVEQIRQRLSDRYQLLTLGSRAAPTRQHTLRLCIDWSYELCTAQEQQVWAQLSVFAGSFELDAAEGICVVDGMPAELLDPLTSLVDKSILIREDHGDVVRFRMLETLRDFGREKARAAGVHTELRRRHHDWYRQLVVDAESDWIGPRQLGWLARLGREQPNIREAMEFVLSDAEGTDIESALQITAALFSFWLSRNLLSEGRFWLDRALAGRPESATTERVKALYADSVLANIQGDLHTGAELVASGQQLVATMTDPVSAARIAHADGLLALYSGDAPRASARLAEALEVFSARDDVGVQVWILMMLGQSYALYGDTARAIDCHQQVLSITESRGESVFRSYSLWAMGVAIFLQGDLSRATRHLEQCLRLCRQIDQPLVTAVCLEVLAWIAGREQAVERAVVLMGAADTQAAAVGSSPILFQELRVYHEECDSLARRKLSRLTYGVAHRKGARLTSSDAIEYALDQLRDRASADTSPNLTKREQQVADLVAQGLSNNQIAAELAISPRTARSHVEHICGKLGLTSRAQIQAQGDRQARTRRG
jgi:non-specific serine/threonine protein kinase